MLSFPLFRLKGNWCHENKIENAKSFRGGIIKGKQFKEDEDDFEIVVPRLKTVTRHGRIAGTWQRHFQIDSESDSDSDNDNDKDEPDNESLAHESEHEAEPEPEARITRSSTRIIKRPSRFC